MKQNVVIEAGIKSVRTMVDGSLNITLETQELAPEQMARVFELRGLPGMVLISTGNISQSEIDVVSQFTADHEIKGKSQSQRIRSVLYVKWEQTQPRYVLDGVEKVMPFDLYYKNQTDIIINHIKSQLD